jgi:hypothetical protein
MSADFALPEIAEADAGGEIAALYETIRADTGSRLVNYVWRHLATIPDAAEWLWAVTRINDHRPLAALIGEVADMAAPVLAAPCRAVAPSEMGATARDIVAVYNGNNVGNLARVFLLLEAMRAAPGRRAAQAGQADAGAPPVGVRLPPLPRFDELAHADLAVIADLSKAGPAADSGIAPSLWRHLAVEPGLLGRLRTPVAEVLASPAFSAAFDDLRARAAAIAAQTPLSVPSAPAFDRAAATAGLARFSRRIAELTLAGRILVQWTLPASPSSSIQGTRP